MKQFSFIILLLSTTCLFSQGIDFFHGTFEEAKLKAQEEEKIIFIDAYATWCGPCKRMAQTVFPDKSVGDFYNKNFISLKIDMEKPEGREFGKIFPVTAYPTLFYINEKGELLQRVMGGKGVEQFLSLGKDIAESYDRSEELAERYNSGERDFDLVIKYVKALNNANKSSLKIANDFLRQNDALTSKQRALFLFEAMRSADSRLFTLFINDRNSIEELVGKEKVKEKIEEACWNTIRNAIDFESESLLSEAKEKMSVHLKSQASDFSYKADFEFAKSRADIALLTSSAMQIAKNTAKNNAESLHDLCNELLQYKNIDATVIESSEKIAKMAVDQSESAQYLLTYSKILSANHKLKKALKSAKKALEKSSDKVEQKEIEEWISHLEIK